MSNVYYDSLKFLNIMKTFLLATKNYDEKSAILLFQWVVKIKCNGYHYYFFSA